MKVGDLRLVDVGVTVASNGANSVPRVHDPFTNSNARRRSEHGGVITILMSSLLASLLRSELRFCNGDNSDCAMSRIALTI